MSIWFDFFFDSANAASAAGSTGTAKYHRSPFFKIQFWDSLGRFRGFRNVKHLYSSAHGILCQCFEVIVSTAGHNGLDLLQKLNNTSKEVFSFF